jgi:hypothetical protein
VGDVILTPQQNDSDRIATLYWHVVVQGHTLKISPQADNYVEVECIGHGDGEPCGEGVEPWWDHWDFDETYVAHIQAQLGAAEEINGAQ